MTALSHLHLLTNRILDAPINAHGELFASAEELYKFLLQLTAIDTEEDKNRKNIPLDSGHAIGLTWAAMCIKDFMRTKKFMDGIYEAVDSVLQKNNDRPVHILYAGTGPFAALLLPLTARFRSTQLQFTLLEVNEYSFHCLQKLIAVLELESYIRRMETADAASWTIPPGELADIFICETMKNGLTKEPQVAIFMNIIPQLKAEAIIIPEKIQLQVALIDPAKRMKHKMGNDEPGTSVYALNNIFQLSRETVLKHVIDFKRSEGNYKFPETTVTIPAEKVAMHSQLCILTDVIVYNTIQLLIDESPLTTPLKLTDLKDPAPGKFKFHYETGKNPGVQFI